jgi:phenylalanine-4-hydroxylase
LPILNAMKQQYDHYTPGHQQVWRLLFDRQIANLQDKASAAYLQSIGAMKDALHSHSIVRFDLLNEVLMQRTGWQIHVVPGLIPAEDFLAFLAERKFCSSTWLRNMQQLDYLEEPDMFHDIFGHVPLLLDEDYATFMQRLGTLGARYAGNPEAIAMLERYYWFTIEFGLIREGGVTRIYGAGIMSSFGEAKSIYTAHAVIRPFSLAHILEHGFVKSELQNEYFEIASYSQLYGSMDEFERILEERCGAMVEDTCVQIV